jgi:hypothetical protein
VPRAWLAVVAGLVWFGVGVMLCLNAIGWLRALHDVLEFPLGVAGLGLGLAAYALMFSRIARKNTARLESLPARVCVFAFQGWRGYGIVAFMITLGITLRHSPIPKHWLAVVYMAIGTALVMSSFVLYRKFPELRAPEA